MKHSENHVRFWNTFVNHIRIFNHSKESYWGTIFSLSAYLAPSLPTSSVSLNRLVLSATQEEKRVRERIGTEPHWPDSWWGGGGEGGGGFEPKKTTQTRWTSFNQAKISSYCPFTISSILISQIRWNFGKVRNVWAKKSPIIQDSLASFCHHSIRMRLKLPS